MDGRSWHWVTGRRARVKAEELHSRGTARRRPIYHAWPQRFDMRDAPSETPFRYVFPNHFPRHFQMDLNHAPFGHLPIRGEINTMVADIHGGGFVFRIGGRLYGAEPQWNLHDQTTGGTALCCRHDFPLGTCGKTRLRFREGVSQFYESSAAGSSIIFVTRKTVRGINAVNSRLSEEEAFGDMDPVLGPIVMGPPIAPSGGIFAERRASDGTQRRVNEVLRGRFERVVVKKIQELGNGSETLLTREHAGTREVGSSAFANFSCGVVSQNGKKRIDGFLGAQHGQSLDGPDTRLLIRIARIAQKRGQNRGGLNAAIAEGAESPEGEIAAVRIVMNLMEKFCQALGRLHQGVGDEIDFHGGDADAGIVGVKRRKHEMKELIGVFQVAAPGIQILVDQAERLVGALDSKFKKALGLLLGSQAADCLHVGVSGAGS